jgi:hypothetical protein
MKKLLPLFVFCITFLAVSQEIKRESITGKIIIEGDDIYGITVFNISSGLATVTNESGDFTIKVTLNDTIEIRALKYQNIDIKINEAILESRKLNVFLIEKINQLDEIVIKSKRLTGNLNVDLDQAKNFNPKGNAVYFGINNNRKNTAREANSNANEKIKKNLPLGTTVDGLNIVNVVDQLLIPLFRSEVADKKQAGIPEVPAKSIKYYFGASFLSENFNIPNHRVEEFIRYVEDDSFDFNLLNYGHEIEFLELLTKKSKLFLKAKKTTD